jgi:hypothetical protein
MSAAKIHVDKYNPSQLPMLVTRVDKYNPAQLILTTDPTDTDNWY